MGGPVPTINIDWRKNSEDIVEYIKFSVQKSRVLRRAPKDVQEEIVNTLSDKANGMFIWVELMLSELKNKTSTAKILASLRRAPRVLPQMLQHVLEGFSSTLKDDDPGELNTLLMWVTCAIRPLSLAELGAILLLDTVGDDDNFLLESKLRWQYGSFFNLSRLDGLSTADLQDDAVADYILSINDKDKKVDVIEEAEIETEFDSDMATTEVSFCHASIGDFFRDETQGKYLQTEEKQLVSIL